MPLRMPACSVLNSLLLPPRLRLQPPADRYTQLLSLSTITTINAALCERHLVNCPPSEELQQQCDKVGWGLLGWVVWR